MLIATIYDKPFSFHAQLTTREFEMGRLPIEARTMAFLRLGCLTSKLSGHPTDYIRHQNRPWTLVDHSHKKLWSIHFVFMHVGETFY